MGIYGKVFKVNCAIGIPKGLCVCFNSEEETLVSTVLLTHNVTLACTRKLARS